jgi:excisionase family DNA binding protein
MCGNRGIVRVVSEVIEGIFMNEISPDDYLSPEDISKLLQNRVTARSVQTWCKIGKLKAIHAGRRWLVRRADFEAFLTSHEEEGNVRGKAEPLAA